MTAKQIHLLFFTILFIEPLMAQKGFDKNDIYVEFGGNGILASINYERQLSKEPAFGLRTGVGIIPLVGVSIPVGFNYLIKTKSKFSFIETGFGFTYLVTKGKESQEVEELNFIPSLGYRRHTKKNYMLRVNITPLFNRSFVFPLVGLSFGKRF